MKQSVHQYQGSLFTPTTTIVDHPKESPTTNPLTPLTVHPETLNIEITREALAAQVMKGLVEHRRWEKELTFGASDEELSKALGNCWSGIPSLNIHCRVEPTPHLICTTTMGQELLRLEAEEIAALIRIHIQIPTVPNDAERKHRLKTQLHKERVKARNDIFTAAKRILGDTSRKREQGFTQQFVDCFLPNTVSKNSPRALLLKQLPPCLLPATGPGSKQ